MSQMAVTSTLLRGETEFLRKNNSRLLQKQKRIHTLQVRGFHLFFIFILLGGAAFTAYKIGVFILTWEKLKIQAFDLKEKPTYRTAEVEALLEQNRVNILSLSLPQLREKLLTFKEIKEVVISRKLPSTLGIRFILRKPVFQVAIYGKYNIMDTEGVILNTGAGSSKELINIRDVKPGQLAKLIPYLPELGRIKDFLEYVSIQDPYGVILKIKGRDEIFYPGETGFAKKINLYLKLCQNPLLKKYVITSVDLRFEDRFYFEYQPMEAAETGGTGETGAAEAAKEIGETEEGMLTAVTGARKKPEKTEVTK